MQESSVLFFFRNLDCFVPRNDWGRKFLEYISKCVEIICTFRHFFVIYEEMSSMEPIFRELFSCESLSLGYLVLMMREHEVDSSHVDVDLISEKMPITCTTLDMPAWSSVDFPLFSIDADIYSPFILTIRFSVICLPECEVSDLLFIVFVIIDADARYHPLEVEVSEITIFLKFCDTIVDTPIIREIGISLPHESIDDLTHIVDKLRYRFDIICRFDAESSTVMEKLFCIVFCEFSEILP
jgi:hypothetical protein